VFNPATGKEEEVMYVKGSGGDLGTLTVNGLAVLRTQAGRELVNVYQGVEREDEMFPLWDFCRFGSGGAAPSIDTAMHMFVNAQHVDHLHPDSIIAIATAKDGRELTKRIFGDELAWVDWRRPGFELGLDMARIQKEHPKAVGCILGGHGLTVWADTSKECQERSLAVIKKAEDYITQHGKPDSLGAIRPAYTSLDERARHQKAFLLAPAIRGVASTDARMVGHFTDSEVVLDFIARDKLAQLAELGTSCPDHFLRTKIRPLTLDLPNDTSIQNLLDQLQKEHDIYRRRYAEYYQKYATPTSPPMRGSDPTVVLVPGVGMFTYGKDAFTARIAGEFYVNAINVMRGAEALSSYDPIPELEKFRVEYWELEEAKLRRLPPPKPLAGRIAMVTGGGSGIGKAIALALAAQGSCVCVADRDLAAAEKVVQEIANEDNTLAVYMDVTDEASIDAAFETAVLKFSGIDILVNNAGISVAKSLLETTNEDWDRQHDIMPRGSFLCSRAATKIMVEQEMGGDIIYIASKNAVVAGPDNVAYGSAKADQAHQVRILAAELGKYGIRVNGINPDGVVQGSGIFSSGWGAQRAALYGVPEDELGAFYAKRTVLGREVFPDDVANAALALLGGALSKTTGLLVPVDSGVPQGFLR
jgi:rhamnulose-1-phosphate aldolase/alcohol dehydrogenase